MRGVEKTMEQMRIIVREREQTDPSKYLDTEWILTAIPPEEGAIHYGTGYYLSAIPIKEDGTPDEDGRILWDMRHARTKNLSKMADIWIRDYFGGPFTKKEEYFVA